MMRLIWNVDKVRIIKQISIIKEGQVQPQTIRPDSWTSWKNTCVYRFIFEEKQVRAIRDGIIVECNGLDETFLKLSARFSANDWQIWEQATQILDKHLDRHEVVEFLQRVAIAKAFNKGGRQ